MSTLLPTFNLNFTLLLTLNLAVGPRTGFCLFIDKKCSNLPFQVSSTRRVETPDTNQLPWLDPDALSQIRFPFQTGQIQILHIIQPKYLRLNPQTKNSCYTTPSGFSQWQHSTRAWTVFGSNPGRETVNLRRGFPWFYSIPPCIHREFSFIRPRSLPSKSSPIHHSSIILPCEELYLLDYKTVESCECDPAFRRNTGLHLQCRRESQTRNLHEAGSKS